MKLNDIQNTILKWASHHHKSTGAVRQHVFDGLGRTFSDKEFSTALLELHSNGLVTSYFYDQLNAGYALIDSPNDYDMGMLHWLITEEPE
ncbi:MAG: hypothetical protein WBP44_02695 [Gammaproteobacteria bacterium]|jgi:hypothetical protein